MVVEFPQFGGPYQGIRLPLLICQGYQVQELCLIVHHNFLDQLKEPYHRMRLLLRENQQNQVQTPYRLVHQCLMNQLQGPFHSEIWCLQCIFVQKEFLLGLNILLLTKKSIAIIIIRITMKTAIITNNV